MTTHKPYGRYDYTVDLSALIFGAKDRTVTVAHDVELQVDVSCELSSGGDLEVRCTDVLVDGESLRNADFLGKAVFQFVMAKADEELEAAGWLWDQVRDAEGLSLTGHPNDPDTHWLQAAE